MENPDRKSNGSISIESIPGAVESPLVWKSLTLGLYKSADEYRRAIQREPKYIEVSKSAQSMLNAVEFAWSPDLIDVDLVTIRVIDLGFPEGGHFDAICDRAAVRGLRMCRPEVGPALRIALLDQPEGDTLYVAMNPIDVAPFSYVFGVESDNFRLSLFGFSIPQSRQINDWNARFVFERPRG